MILSSIVKALRQIGDQRFRQVLLLGIGLSVLFLVGATLGVFTLINWSFGPEASLPLIGPVSWASDVMSWASVLAMLVLSVFLMMPVASAIISLFLERVVQAVEDKHYPNLPVVTGIPLGQALFDMLNFLLVLLAANLVALLLYALFFPVAPFIFWGMNGFLLGREYFQLVATRRLGWAEAKALRRRHTGKIWLAGTLVAVPLSMPLVNLVIPILAVATFTHLFHQLSPVPSD
ncbi:MAG TPA: hypothetical protein DEA94_02555 [Rhodobacteraceae bacterium]|nr:hypothetical protein [Paracoccaceae bacterium]|tara:strand:+ start:414 stop:1112 length:699 start_codon:yes stop_codon:yes gene_type:complete